jgi:galactokinase
MNKSYITVKSPGRVNIIGEHIDYNGGYVLPGATDLFIKLTFSESQEKFSEIYSEVIDKKCKINFDNLLKREAKWENYLIGSLVSILKKRKVELKNFKCSIEGNLPIGSGISSSSSLICGFVRGLDILNNLQFDTSELLSISKEVEYDFIGLKGGIMDQFTIINSKKNNLILLNTKDNTSQYIKSELGDYKILLLNTNKKHDLSESSYNDRVRECNEALDIINNSGHKINYLTEMKVEKLVQLKNLMPENIFNRALYVIEENIRTIQSVQYLKNSDLVSLGELMYLSHEGLKNLYEVSCNELDYLVDKTITHKEILGARMMGGGFGGCTINLIHSDFIDSFVSDISNDYSKKFSLNLSPILTSLGEGLRYNL